MASWRSFGDGNDIVVPDIPYMGYLKDELEEEHPQEEPKSFEELAFKILRRTYIEDSRKGEIVLELKRLLQAKGAVWTDMYVDVGRTDFVITRENKYFKTNDIFYFLDEYYNPVRVFMDSVSNHYYDNLLNNPKFQEEIKKREKETGWKFSGCGGGYDSTYHLYKDKFELLDECGVVAHFKIDDNSTAGYDIDFSDLTLSDEYMKFERHGD